MSRHSPPTVPVTGSDPTPSRASNGGIVDGPLLRAIVSLAAPMLLSAVLSNVQSLIDLFWVGRLGPQAIAAVAISGLVVWVLSPMLMGVATGTVALVARAVGAGRRADAAAAAGQSLLLAGLFGGLTALLGSLYSNRLLMLLGAAPEVREIGQTYLRILLWGSVSVFILFVANAALQGSGNALVPMRLMMLANVINLVLDPLLIFGPGPFPRLGVAGAAWATVMADGTAALCALDWLTRAGGPIGVNRGSLKPSFGLMWRLLRIGIPSSGQMLARSLMTAALMRVVAAFGTAAVAAYGAGMRLHMVVLMPAFALGGAAATIVGQNLGAGRPDRARRGAWLAATVGMAILAIAGAILLLFATPLIRLFNHTPDVVRLGADYLRTVSPFYLFAAVGIVLGRALNGAGDSISPMLFTVTTLWGLQVPMAVGLSRLPDVGVRGIWWAIAVATTLHGLLVAVWFSTGRWQRVRV